MPKSLDLDRLKKFEPMAKQSEEKGPSEPIQSSVDRWPSREPNIDGQISIKGPMKTIQRFKAMCKDDRRTYADMLDILMNHFEENR